MFHVFGACLSVSLEMDCLDGREESKRRRRTTTKQEKTQTTENGWGKKTRTYIHTYTDYRLQFIIQVIDYKKKRGGRTEGQLKCIVCFLSCQGHL